MNLCPDVSKLPKKKTERSDHVAEAAERVHVIFSCSPFPIEAIWRRPVWGVRNIPGFRVVGSVIHEQKSKVGNLHLFFASNQDVVLPDHKCTVQRRADERTEFRSP
jgi:hypothetical protein